MITAMREGSKSAYTKTIHYALRQNLKHLIYEDKFLILGRCAGLSEGRSRCSKPPGFYGIVVW